MPTPCWPRTGPRSRMDPPARGASAMSPVSRSGPPSRVVAPGATGGANVNEVGPRFGIAGGMDGARPSAALPLGSTAMPSRPSCSAFSALSGRAAAPPGTAAFSGAGRNSAFAALEASRPMGATAAGSDMSSASSRPPIITTVSRTAVPGAVIRPGRLCARALPMIPPWVGSKSSTRPRLALKPTAVPKAVSSQSPRTPLARSTIHQPTISIRKGSTRRPKPTQGAIESRHQSVSFPSPGSIRAISVATPMSISARPISDRTTSGAMRGAELLRLLRRRAAAGRLLRLVAEPPRVDIRPPPRPGRRAAAAASARTGTARPRPLSGSSAGPPRWSDRPGSRRRP